MLKEIYEGGFGFDLWRLNFPIPSNNILTTNICLYKKWSLTLFHLISINTSVKTQDFCFVVKVDIMLR